METLLQKTFTGITQIAVSGAFEIEIAYREGTETELEITGDEVFKKHLQVKDSKGLLYLNLTGEINISENVVSERTFSFGNLFKGTVISTSIRGKEIRECSTQIGGVSVLPKITLKTSAETINLCGMTQTKIGNHPQIKTLTVGGQSGAELTKCSLQKVSLSGQSNLEGEEITSPQGLSLTISGQCEATLSGIFADVDLTISGISKAKLKGEAASVSGSVSGMSKAKLPLTIHGKSRVSTSGMSSVKY